MIDNNRRLEFHELLCQIANSENVYFQPPGKTMIKYPAIVYNLEDLSLRYADNGVYFGRTRYSVTLIDKNPDSPLVGKLAQIPTARFSRHFASENLNHYVFSIYY